MRAAIGALIVLVAGCVSMPSVQVEGLNRPLADLQKIAARSLPLGQRKISSNGREFYSNYFVALAHEFKPADSLSNRNFAQILVLGDRRPYAIQVVVYREQFSNELSGGGYRTSGTDQTLAHVVLNKINRELNKRREDLNIIDDFRVF
jgi:hypothetical protein